MNVKAKSIIMAAALFPALTVLGQGDATERFSIKATADIGLGNSISCEKTLPGLDAKSASSNYGLDFGWTFWTHHRHSLEANIGLAYSQTSLTMDLADIDYSYSAGPEADMDGEPYIRYCSVKGVAQKLRTQQLLVPIYIDYGYKFSKRISAHAMTGLNFGFKLSSKALNSSGEVFSYGVYPQYDDLMIDAPYMNEFGEGTLDKGNTQNSRGHKVTASWFAGVGAEVWLAGPISLEVSLKYELGLSNVYKRPVYKMGEFTSTSAPVTYTVAEGQTVKPLTDYLSKSKFSRLSLGLSLIYRF